MCTDHHDGTCTGILSLSRTQSDHLVMSLVCESCNEVVRSLGSIEHKFDPVLTVASPDMNTTA